MAKAQNATHKVGRVMHAFKEGGLKLGNTGKVVVDPKQAVAIGLTEARKAGAGSAAGPAPGHPAPVPDTGTSVAGEEDPGAALDLTRSGEARRH